MKSNLLKALVFIFIFSTDCFSDKENSQNIDTELIVAMEAYQVPVVGYAIIKNHQIALSNTLSINPNLPVSKDSLFQAASISKSVSAYGALKLVSQGKLTLDDSVNDRLTEWKIPKNKYNEKNPVTLR